MTWGKEDSLNMASITPQEAKQIAEEAYIDMR